MITATVARPRKVEHSREETSAETVSPNGRAKIHLAKFAGTLAVGGSRRHVKSDRSDDRAGAPASSRPRQTPPGAGFPGPRSASVVCDSSSKPNSRRTSLTSDRTALPSARVADRMLKVSVTARTVSPSPSPARPSPLVPSETRRSIRVGQAGDRQNVFVLRGRRQPGDRQRFPVARSCGSTRSAHVVSINATSRRASSRIRAAFGFFLVRAPRVRRRAGSPAMNSPGRRANRGPRRPAKENPGHASARRAMSTPCSRCRPCSRRRRPPVPASS